MKKYMSSLPCTSVTAGEDIPHISAHQTKLVLSLISLKYSEGKEKITHFHFHLSPTYR